MTRSNSLASKECSQQARRIQKILLAALLIAGAVFLLWGRAQKPEMLDVKLEEIKMISYGAESIGITEPEQLRQEYARLNEALARQDELRELYRQLHDPNPERRPASCCPYQVNYCLTLQDDTVQTGTLWVDWP